MKVENIATEEAKDLLSQDPEGVTYDCNADVYGVRKDGKLVAIAGILFNHTSTARFKMDFTLPEYRSMGILSRLMKFRLAVCKNTGIKKVRACCLPPSLGIYLKNGFTVTRNHGSGTDVVIEL